MPPAPRAAYEKIMCNMEQGADKSVEHGLAKGGACQFDSLPAAFQRLTYDGQGNSAPTENDRSGTGRDP